MHYIIISIVIAVIVGVQVYIWRNTSLLIRQYRSIFKGVRFKTVKYYDQEETGETITEESDKPEVNGALEITCIGTEEEIKHPLLKKIVDSINVYLKKNKGAVSDFLLVKDIVERNCETKHEELNVQVPMPLYLGLMGTMVGIILGIGYITIGGEGFSGFTIESIETLMGGVAVAMIASFVGIFFTTRSSWCSKTAEAEVEEGKNDFYTWIQTELLPNIGGMENTLVTLQQNLMTFNRSFAVNTNKLDKTLKQMGDSYDAQRRLLYAIQELDVVKMAKANVSVLKELQDCVPLLERFAVYLRQVDTFVDSANQLNTAINNQLARTHLIEEMGTFFKQEVEAIEQRKAAIYEAIGKVDDCLQKTFESLGGHAEQGMQQVNEALIRKQDVFVQTAEEQQNAMLRNLEESGRIFEKFGERMMGIAQNQFDEMSKRLEQNMQKEDEALRQRQGVFAQAMGTQQETMRRSLQETGDMLEKLGERMAENMRKVNEELISKQEEFGESMRMRQEALQQKVEASSSVFEELRHLSAVKEAVERQNEKVDQELAKLDALRESVESQREQLSGLVQAVKEGGSHKERPSYDARSNAKRSWITNLFGKK